MSQIRTAKAGDHGAFPGSTFVIDDTPPIAQCQETQIVAVPCTITNGQYTVTKAAAFPGIDLAGKKVIILNSLVDDGTYNIISNTDDVLTTDHQFNITEGGITATCKDAAGAYLTRNESSFSRFIESQSKAHTTKGGQLFTDIANPPINGACSDTFAPQ